MIYDDARGLRKGELVRLDTGETGEVHALHDTGISMLLTIWDDQRQRLYSAHSSHVWRCATAPPTRRASAAHE